MSEICPLPPETDRRTFDLLVALADRFRRRSRLGGAAVCAQMAARLAWLNHVGLMASRPLESLLRQVGHRRVPGQEPAIRRLSPVLPAHVVHVLTGAHAAGGHTRLVWRWAEFDRVRRHSVILTAQAGRRIPAELESAIHATGGSVRVLRPISGGTLIDQARLLRRSSIDADLIVLHADPCDVIPSLAFADPTGRAAVVLMNHADHVFWLGVGVADFVACFRRSGAALAARRRGIAYERSGLLPLPIPLPKRRRSRAEAKLAIGVDPEATVLLTAASDYKYASLGPATMPTVVAPVLERWPHAVLIAAGPAPRGEWTRFGARVQARGHQSNMAPFFEAADIYLDSFPFASITSFLEAASYGTPVLQLRTHPNVADVLHGDDPSIEEHGIVAMSVEQYRDALESLIRDPRERRQRGVWTEMAVRDVHCGAAWRSSLNRLYEAAMVARKPSSLMDIPDASSPDALDKLVAETHQTGKSAVGLDAIFLWEADLLPISARIALARLLRGHGVPFHCGTLLPRWLDEALDVARRFCSRWGVRA